MSHFCLLKNDSNIHCLLEPPSPAYSNVTVRRAFVVWLHCGQQNEFRQVCNYYHHLESLEKNFSTEDRATSRLHEFHLISAFPPLSHYLNIHFPMLYLHNENNKVDVNELEELTLEESVFNLVGYHDMKIQKSVTTKDVIKISQIIRSYCKSHSKSLNIFFEEFQDFINKTKATNSVTNILMYIKKKYLVDELETWKNMPKTFSFLDSLEDVRNDNVNDTNTEVFKNSKIPAVDVYDTINANKNANKITMLVNESKRKKQKNIPNISEFSIEEHNCFTNQNDLSEKLPNIHHSMDNYHFIRKM